MLIRGHFLILEHRDIVNISLHRPSIKVVVKHFDGHLSHLVICSGANCRHCDRGIQPRNRYVAQVVVEGQNLSWEFGDEVYLDLPEPADDHGWLNLVVTRLGSGRKTRYQVRELQQPTDPRLPLNSRQCPICQGWQLPANYSLSGVTRCACARGVKV